MTVTFESNNREAPVGELRTLLSTGGKSPLPVDVETVRALAFTMCSREEMAHYLNVSPATLTRRLREEPWRSAFLRGRAQGRIQVRRKQFDLANKGHAGMLIWLGKQYLGQRDVHHIASYDADEILDEDVVEVRWTEVHEAELEDLRTKLVDVDYDEVSDDDPAA